MSDIHAEFYSHESDWLPPLPDNPDVLVLGGDVHVGSALIALVRRVGAALPQTHIIVIAGNHEFYHQYRLQTLQHFREAFTADEQIHFLENDHIDIGGIRFIGATLWTGFPLHLAEHNSEQVMAYAQENVPDFRVIADDTEGIKVFTPTMAKRLFEESKAKIEAILAISDPETCIVITHFPPVKQLQHPHFAPDKISSYFTADCLDLIKTYQPAYWFYGHNHWSLQSLIGKTQLISNQFGYPNERVKMGGTFDPHLLLTLNPKEKG